MTDISTWFVVTNYNDDRFVIKALDKTDAVIRFLNRGWEQCPLVVTWREYCDTDRCWDDYYELPFPTGTQVNQLPFGTTLKLN